MKSRLLLFAILFCGLIIQTNAQTVMMTIEGIRNNKGVITLGIFKSQEQFTQEKPAIGKVFAKTTLKSGVLKIEFNLEPGNYAIAVVDDENEDGVIKYNWLGVPLEGFGFSNYVSRGLRKPRYSDFSFEVKQGENKVHVKMRYIL